MDKEELPFAEAKVVRLMRENLDEGKWIRDRVKKGMNKFLGKIARKLTREMNKKPYKTLTMDLFKEAKEPFEKIGELETERERIIANLKAIKKDCDSLIESVKSKYPKD